MSKLTTAIKMCLKSKYTQAYALAFLIALGDFGALKFLAWLTLIALWVGLATLVWLFYEGHRSEIAKLTSQNKGITSQLMEQIEGLRVKRRDFIPPSWRVEIVNRDECQCTYCGREGDKETDPDGASWHIDHIVPQSRGGPTHRENLTLSCAGCNVVKNSRPAYVFIRERSQG